MENKELYQRILKKAFAILCITSAITFFITKAWMYVFATLLGGILSVLGFVSIVYFTHHASLEGDVKTRFTSAYIFRYLIYFIVMFMGAKAGLNIVSMLLGFLCINLAIKMDTLFRGKEEN